MRKQGSSYNEIYERLKIPKATLSDWFSAEDWSIRVKKKLIEASKISSAVRIVKLDTIRGNHLKNVYEEAKREASLELASLKYNPLFIAGIMLYWGEGDKRTRGQVRLVNTEPEIIRLFVLFLTEVCRIPHEKIRASVTIYPDLNELECRKYWSDASGIPIESFTKCVTIQGRHKTRKLSYGMCNVLVLSTYFKIKLLEWLRLLPQELMGRAYYESM